ncbi:MAG TPA: PAS domain-containing sensor histidine kinase, partial [Alcanivorax sp.]|nr:PAS domain-containing sensor histidine kinase [Alcanivorax sp.]HCJ65562.1 PAS domain-containing sensor histidine kinase [Alcanivorax sp.]HCQ36136.1 PAS domain-containing sensor histidine kinase [Alcanivorax sp.]
GEDGELYWVNMFIFPLSYITDEDDGYIYFGTDITQIKAQNSELIQAVRDKDDKINQVESMLLHSEKMASLGTISAGIAHEINNPIAFVSANLRRSEQYLTTLSKVIAGLRRRISPERFEQFLQAEQSLRLNMDSLEMILNDHPHLMRETSEGIDRIKKIIRDLKHFSHNEQERYQPVDLSRCVATSMNLARHELERVRVTTHLPPDLPPVNGSESQLSQVLMNILVNAAQAVEQDGEIRIEAHSDEQSYCLSVTDNGPGMDAAQLEQIFEPFFTTKPIGQGTGLGLSISQDIIQRHGGTLTATSAPGEGTRIDIRLPLAEKKRAHAA